MIYSATANVSSYRRSRAGSTRRLKRILAVAVAAGKGALIRVVRRLLGLPPRICHGTYPMHMLHDMVRADRAAGYPSRSLVSDLSLAKYALVTASEFDEVLETGGCMWDDRHWMAACRLLTETDIWVTFFDSVFAPSTTPARAAPFLRLFRMCGIKIIVLPNGLDVIHRPTVQTRYDWVSRVEADYPAWDIAGLSTDTKERISLFCRFADLVVSGDSATTRFLPRNELTFKYFAVDDTRVISHNARPSNPTPVIAHAPNHQAIKGTKFLVHAVDVIRQHGHACDLQLIEKVPRQEALKLYSQADIIADQFCIGAYGVFALEGMSLGKPVLAYLDQEQLGDPVFNLPIVNTNRDNLPAVLAVLVALPELCERLGAAGKAAVRQYQSIAAMAEVWDRIYQHVWHGHGLDLKSTQVFSTLRKPRSFIEDPSEVNFWPVQVDDLLPRIRQLVKDVE